VTNRLAKVRAIEIDGEQSHSHQRGENAPAAFGGGKSVMRFVRTAGFGLLLACAPLGSIGCTSLSGRPASLSMASRPHAVADEYRLAMKAEQQKDYARARDLYASLQRKSPEVPLYAHRMGVVSTQLGDHATASKYFEHARKLDPNNVSLLTDMGYSAIMQQDYSKAEGLLQQAVKLKPDNVRAVNNLAMAIGYQGRFDESLATFRKANSESNAHSNLAYVHIQRGEPQLALDCYRRAAAREPGNKSYGTMMAQLESQLAQGIPPVQQLAQTELPSATQVVATEVATQEANPFETNTAAELPQLSGELPTAPLLSSTAEPPLVHASEFLSPEQRADSVETATLGNRINKAAASRPRDRRPDEEDLPFFEDEVSEQHADAIARDGRSLQEFEPPLIVPNGPYVSPVVGTQSSTGPRTASLEVTSSTVVSLPREIPQAAWDEDLQLNSTKTKTANTSLKPDDELASAFIDDDNRPETKSVDSEELTGLEWVKDEQAALSAKSTSPETGFTEFADGLKGFCPVAIRDDRRPTPALDEFSFEYQSQVYRFSSADALTKFRDNPELYAPMAGGLDVVAVRLGASVANGSLDHAVWYRHRLHLFSSVENLLAFRAAPRTFASAQ
jgi:tetratricopeptide (TPR) repeat protein/YHS domain-containing protein